MAEQLERLGIGKAQIVDIGRQPQLRQQVEVAADPGENEPRIDEIRLTLALGRPQIGQNPIIAAERNAAAADQRYRLANPEAGISAGELWVLEHGVEAGGVAALRMAV